MASSIGERIRELRTTLRLTQDQFGNKIGVKNGVVSAWEKGSAPVPDGRVRIIRDEYNASIDWILKGEGEMFQESTEDPNAKRDAALEYALSLIRKLPAVERNDAVEFIRELVRRCDDDYVSALRKPSSKNAQSDVPEIVIASADDDFNEISDDDEEFDLEDDYDDDDD
jgi:transcriptional regulator with XRE-family HTH domain